MPPDTSSNETKEEGNLLIEAVSLLVQRQRETESWVAEQIWQAEERADAAERRYTELEARLTGIEEHVARLSHDLEPSRQEPAAQERLSRLREQVEGLKSSGADGRGTRPTPIVASPSAAPSLRPVAEPAPGAPRETPVAARDMATVPPEAPIPQPTKSRVASSAVAASGSNASLWELLGSTPQDRAGAILIFAGAVAVLYALLLQVRF